MERRLGVGQQSVLNPVQDEGDPAVDVSPRDLVFTLPADEAALPSASPRQLAATNLRYGGISWGDGDLALIYESWWKTRRSIVCTFAPDRPGDGLKVGPGGAWSLLRSNQASIKSGPGAFYV